MMCTNVGVSESPGFGRVARYRQNSVAVNYPDLATIYIQNLDARKVLVLNVQRVNAVFAISVCTCSKS